MTHPIRRALTGVLLTLSSAATPAAAAGAALAEDGRAYPQQDASRSGWLYGRIEPAAAEASLSADSVNFFDLGIQKEHFFSAPGPSASGCH